MQADHDHDGLVTLHLSAACRNAALAAPLLAAKLGISPTEAADRLCAISGPISAPLSRQSALHLRSILSALGVRLELHPPDPAHPPSFDLSLRVADWADPEKAVAQLEQIIGGSRTDLLASLALPSGLLLTDLSAADCANLDLRLRRIRGLVAQRLDRRHACIDIFTTRPLQPEQGNGLSQIRRRLGLSGDPMSGAVLSGLGLGPAERVMGILRDCGLTAVDRAFQRFDLHLTGYAGWLTKDLADFLAARTGQPRARFEFLSPDEPIRLDAGLSYQHARRFCADYAAIGLFVRPVLRGLLKNSYNTIC